MLKSCKYCGRIHDSKFDCGKKPKRGKDRTDLDRFRSSKAWQRKREQIKERDLQLCRLSWFLDGKVVYDNLSVHHIEPLEEAWEKRLDDDNLITLSGYYHELAESGEIDAELLKMLAKQSPGGQGIGI